MNDETVRDPLVHVLTCIHAELHRVVDFELAQWRQEQATRAMRRARAASCGNCLHFLPADWAWLESRGRTLPTIQHTGHCTAQARAPTRRSDDPTERQAESPPCGRYETLCWPDGSPVDPQDENDDC